MSVRVSGTVVVVMGGVLLAEREWAARVVCGPPGSGFGGSRCQNGGSSGRGSRTGRGAAGCRFSPVVALAVPVDLRFFICLRSMAQPLSLTGRGISYGRGHLAGPGKPLNCDFFVRCHVRCQDREIVPRDLRPHTGSAWSTWSAVASSSFCWRASLAIPAGDRTPSSRVWDLAVTGWSPWWWR